MTNEEAIVKLAHAVANVAARAGDSASVAEAHEVVRALTPEPPPPAEEIAVSLDESVEAPAPASPEAT